MSPIASDKPGMHDIAIDVAYRYSDYGSGITTDTYKIRRRLGAD